MHLFSKPLFHSVSDEIIYIQMSRAAEATGTKTKCLKSQINQHCRIRSYFNYVTYVHNFCRNAHFHKTVVDF